jgi:hypothetical protein
MPTDTITPTATAAFPVASAPVFCGVDTPDTYISYSASTVTTLDLEHRDGGFTVSDPVTGIFGAGDTPFDAMQDIAAALREHREVLEAQAELTPALQAQLDHLRQLI